MTRHKKHKLRFRSLYLWHRYLGLTAALFVVILSITGILLNHTEEFDFDSHFVQSDIVLDWYGIETPNEIYTFTVNQQHLSLFGEHLYLDTLELPGNYNHLIGAAALSDFIVVSVDDSILLISYEGEVIDHLKGSDGVPSGMRSIGLTQNKIVIQGGHALYQPDADFLRWHHWDGKPNDIEWLKPDKLPMTLHQELSHHYRGEVLPIERVLLDLHSGRFFGTWGIYAMDAAAIILLILAMTGSWLWLSQKHKRRQRKKYHSTNNVV